MYLDDKTYLEVLSLKNNDYADFETCYNYLNGQLDLWYGLDFKDDIHLIVKPVTEKFIKICKTLIGDNKLYDELRNGLNSLVGEILTGKNERKTTYFYTITTRIHELKILVEPEITGVEESPIPELIIPNLSDKNQAIDLLTNAIKIIGSCSGLKPKARNKIIKFLTDALNELNSENTNWTYFFGKVNYVKMSLVTISVLLGGLTAGKSLLSDKEKIDNVISLTEESQKVIMDYSINISRLSIINVFEIEKNFHVEGNKIILPENSIK